MVDGDPTGPLTPEGWKDLELLRWFQHHAPDLMTSRSRLIKSDLEERIWAFRHKQAEEHVRRWLPTLTPQKVDELERKLAAGGNLTPDEAQQWFAAVEASRPVSSAPSALDRWNMRTISQSLYGMSCRRPKARVIRVQPRRRSSRARRTVRTSRGSPRQDGPDPLPPDLDPSRLRLVLGPPRCWWDANVWPSLVWRRLRREAEVDARRAA